MKQYDNTKLIDAEFNVVGSILLRPQLINELYVDENTFRKPIHLKLIRIFKKLYFEKKAIDIPLICSEATTDTERSELLDYCVQLMESIATASNFYWYQELMIEEYKNILISTKINSYSTGKLTIDELIENINTIQNETMIVLQKNKRTPEEMLSMIRNKEKIITFPRFWALNERLQIKKKTVNVIGARPSEGKSALALNLFCDLTKEYKCIYFNMEMTEEEVYERMLGIEADMPIKYIVKPETEHQDNFVKEIATKIYNYKYEVINGSKTINSIRKKVIKEQRDEHLIIFIDYIGYIVGKEGMSDKDRIGEAVRDLNNMTKDYNCTVFLVAQINRNGSDLPTMQDLKDSGEIEQTADTIILIHDDNKEDTSVKKEIGFLIPKCRGSRRNIRIPVMYDKEKQRMEVK